MGGSYRERCAAPELTRFVDAVWTAGLTSSQGPRYIVPDARADIIVRLDGLGGPHRIDINGAPTQPVLRDAQSPPLLIGVRFRPGRALPFFAPSELRDQRVPLADVWPGEIGELTDAVAAARTPRGVAEAIEALLLRRLRASDRVESRAVMRAIAILDEADGTSIGEVAATLGLSARQLRRVFEAATGVRPKTYARVARFQKVLRLVSRGPAHVDWAAVACACGYFDQSHLVHEFRRMAQCTPEQWMAGSYNTRDRRPTTLSP